MSWSVAGENARLQKAEANFANLCTINNPEVGYREMAQKWVVRSDPKVGRKKVAQKLDITAKLSKYFTSPILGRESSIVL